MKPTLSLALGYYDHVTDVVTGRAPVEGVDLHCLQIERPSHMFTRFMNHREFDASEVTFGGYAALRGRGDDEFTGIPVFPARLARHASIYIRKDKGIASPRDLEGKRVGIPEWAQTAVLWTRGLLQHFYGVDIATIKWVQGGREEHVPPRVPSRFSYETRPTEDLGELLLQGRLDAVIAAHPPGDFGEKGSLIGRLFEDYVAEEKRFVRESGFLPIMHTFAIRTEVLHKHPWIARNLFDALEHAKNLSVARMRRVASHVPLPWSYHLAQEDIALLGKDFWPYGVEPNRKALDAFLLYAHEQGVTDKKLTPEDLFPPQFHGPLGDRA